MLTTLITYAKSTTYYHIHYALHFISIWNNFYLSPIFLRIRKFSNWELHMMTQRWPIDLDSCILNLLVMFFKYPCWDRCNYPTIWSLYMFILVVWFRRPRSPFQTPNLIFFISFSFWLIIRIEQEHTPIFFCQNIKTNIKTASLKLCLS